MAFDPKKRIRPPGGHAIPAHPHTQHSAPEDFHQGFFRTFDGTNLFYSVEGEGPPIIFCYGLVCSSLHWTYQIEFFRKRYQTIWFDYRGHQVSEKPARIESITIENIATDLRVLLDQLKIDKAVLLGHSMGVNVVLDFYRQAPDRVAGMVLANGTAKAPLETMFKINAMRSVFGGMKKLHRHSPKILSTLWKLQKNNPFMSTIVALLGFNPYLVNWKDVELYLNTIADLDPAIFVQLIESYDHHDAVPWLDQIRAPTLILSGENDTMTPPANQELLHQLIPGSQYEMIRLCSHCPQMELPELLNLRIQSFLTEIGYTGSTSGTATDPKSGSNPTKGSANPRNSMRPVPAA